MNPILRNILVVLGAILAGSTLNGVIIMTSSYIIPPPEGANLETMEGLIAAMSLMQPIHFLMPFLAHALGTFLGAYLAAKFTSNHPLIFALSMGALFFVAGAMNVYMLPAPMWFNVVDLVGAYLPMAYLGYVLGKKQTHQ